MYITGTLQVKNADYLTSVSAVGTEVNGQQFSITYIDVSGNLKATCTSLVTDANGIPSAMSNCRIVQ